MNIGEYLTADEINSFSSSDYKFYGKVDYNESNNTALIYVLEGFVTQINGKMHIHEFLHYNCFRQQPIEIPDNFHQITNLEKYLNEEKNCELFDYLEKYRFGDRISWEEYKSTEEYKNHTEKIEELQSSGYEQFNIKNNNMVHYKVFVDAIEKKFVIYALNENVIYDKTNQDYTKPVDEICILSFSGETPEDYNEYYNEDEFISGYLKRDKVIKVDLSEMDDLNILFEKFQYDKKILEGSFDQIWIPDGKKEIVVDFSSNNEPSRIIVDAPEYRGINLLFQISEKENKYLLVSQKIKELTFSDYLLDFHCIVSGCGSVSSDLITENFVYTENLYYKFFKGFPRNEIEKIVGSNWNKIFSWGFKSIHSTCGKLLFVDELVNKEEICKCDPNDGNNTCLVSYLESTEEIKYLENEKLIHKIKFIYAVDFSN